MSFPDHSSLLGVGPDLKNIEVMLNHSELFRAECKGLIQETDKAWRRMQNDDQKRLGKQKWIFNTEWKTMEVNCNGSSFFLKKILLSRSAGQRYPVSDKRIAAKAGGGHSGDWCSYDFTEQCCEGSGGHQRASESHCSLSGGEVRQYFF